MKERKDGYDLLRIIAMAMIVIAHSLPIYGAAGTPGMMILTHAEPGIQRIPLTCFQYMGQQGNGIFVMVSSFFLLETDRIRTRKVWRMELDSLLISLLFLLLYELMGYHQPPREVFRYSFPTLHMNNWFVGTYMIFYLLHPAYNFVIRKLSRRAHLSALLAGGFFYSLIPSTISDTAFYSTNLSGFIYLYFIVAYVKRYMPSFQADRKRNRRLLIAAVLGQVGMILLLIALGLRYEAFSYSVIRVCRFQAPLMILTALALLNLAGQWKLKPSPLIRRVGSITLLIYLIHENPLVCLYTKPAFWTWIYETIGYHFVTILALVVAALVFVISTAAAMLYSRLLDRPLEYAAGAVDRIALGAHGKLVQYILHRQKISGDGDGTAAAAEDNFADSESASGNSGKKTIE